jgi:hypothetical protein
MGLWKFFGDKSAPSFRKERPWMGLRPANFAGLFLWRVGIPALAGTGLE